MARLVETRWIPVHRPAYAVALSSRPQYVVGGLEGSVCLFSGSGEHLADYSPIAAPVAVHQVLITPDMTRLFLATRIGHVMQVDLNHRGNTFDMQKIPVYHAQNDVHTIAFSEQENCIAIGHLSQTLTLVAADRSSSDNPPLWQQCLEEGNAPEGQVWSVALSSEGHYLYAGSAGPWDNTLLTCDWRKNLVQERLYAGRQITQVAALPGSEGVVVVLAEDNAGSTLVVYPPDLTEPRWELSFHEPVLALTTDPQQSLIAACVGYEGRIIVVDGQGYLKVEDFVLRTLVNDLALVQGRWLAAATEDGHLVLMHYLDRAS